MPENRLLILCHNGDQCRDMTSYFQDSGYVVTFSTDYDEAVDMLRNDKHKPGLLIFAFEAPGRREYEIVECIREFSRLPIIMISEDGRLETQLYAYSKKIDDYMISPVPMPLVEAHVEAVLRRSAAKKNSVVKAGAITLDYDSRKIYLDGQILKVTAKEFDFDYVGGYRSVDTLVKKIRAKLTSRYPYIQTVYGVGYCFDV